MNMSRTVGGQQAGFNRHDADGIWLRHGDNALEAYNVGKSKGA